MLAVAHGWKPPASSGIKVPVSVAKDFVAADQKIGRIGGGKMKGARKDA